MFSEDNSLVIRILKINCPFVAVWHPWYWMKSDANRLRKEVGNKMWKAKPNPVGKTILVIKAILWPLVALLGIVVSWMVHCKDTCLISGRGRIKQFMDLLHFSIWRGFPPNDY